jgi:hypothetical protein
MKGLQGPSGFDVCQGRPAEVNQSDEKRQEEGKQVESGLMAEYSHWLYFTRRLKAIPIFQEKEIIPKEQRI